MDRYGGPIGRHVGRGRLRDMAFSSWRGIVGMINPTMRPGVTEEVIRLLPKGIGLIPLFLNFRRGSGKINEVFAKYFEDAGFTVRDMAGIEVPFDKVQELSGEQVYAHIKRNFLKHKGADVIYMLGSGWRTLEIVQTLEQDLGVPVVHPVTARVWEIQKRLHVREPRAGYGHLLEALP
jgi:hypothetical protein